MLQIASSGHVLENIWRELCTLLLACSYTFDHGSKPCIFISHLHCIDWVIPEMDCIYHHESRFSWERVSWNLFQPYISWYVLCFVVMCGLSELFCSHVTTCITLGSSVESYEWCLFICEEYISYLMKRYHSLSFLYPCSKIMKPCIFIAIFMSHSPCFFWSSFLLVIWRNYVLLVTFYCWWWSSYALLLLFPVMICCCMGGYCFHYLHYVMDVV